MSLPFHEEHIEAWWFAAGDRLAHGDDRPIVLGETHAVDGKVIPCRNALHASREPFDALWHASGPYLYKVRVWGDVVEDGDGIGARYRKYIEMADATDMMREFAQEQDRLAGRVGKSHDIVSQYIIGGNEIIKDARSAALFSAGDAAVIAADRAFVEDGEIAAMAAGREAARASYAAARTRFNEYACNLFDKVTHA